MPTSDAFQACIPLLLASEGGNDDDPRDPGGRTSRGIIQREYDLWRQSHPGLPSDVWQAPQQTVVDIYHQNYWNAMRCDEMPRGVDYAAFDFGVLSGISRSATFLQKLVGTNADGRIGPITLAAIAKVNPTNLIDQLCDRRLAWLQTLSTWRTYGHGWGTRVERIRNDAKKMVTETPPIIVVPPSPVVASGLLDPNFILAIMAAHDCKIEMSPQRVNPFYLEGVNSDGTRNDNVIDKWNDQRGILQFRADGKPYVSFHCAATTEPGKYYDRDHVIGSGPKGSGAALIAPGQQFVWQVGIHHAGSANAHEALVQTGGEVVVYRDYDRSFRRREGSQHKGWFGINQHSTGISPVSDDSIGAHSAGCLVCPHMVDHREYMRIIKTDEQYVADHSFVFGATIIPVDWQVALVS